MEQLPILTAEERLPLLLRGIYEQYGFKRYRMGRFEPYDIYWQNRNFLKSEQVITFTNLDGRLMALRPDVTVSIAKNLPAATSTAKLYYMENVFRLAPGSREYSEISQIGLENIGSDDLYSEAETLLLACKSLEQFSDDYLLCLGHMGIISALMEACEPNGEEAAAVQETVLELLRQKNSGELNALAAQLNLTPPLKELLNALPMLSGTPAEVLPALRPLCGTPELQAACRQLSALTDLLEQAGYGARLRLDFSILSDLDYYNGLVFRGFIRELPTAVLSGGRYDKLMTRFNKQLPAIGFAVYWGEAGRTFRTHPDYDADVLLVYGSGSAQAALAQGDMLREQGLNVRCEPAAPAGFRARQVLELAADGTWKETANA